MKPSISRRCVRSGWRAPAVTAMRVLSSMKIYLRKGLFANTSKISVTVTKVTSVFIDIQTFQKLTMVGQMRSMDHKAVSTNNKLVYRIAIHVHTMSVVSATREKSADLSNNIMLSISFTRQDKIFEKKQSSLPRTR